MEKKKLKLTISGSSRRTKDSIELAKSQGKKTVVIEKKSRFSSKPSFHKNETQRKFQNKPNNNFQSQKPSFSKPNQSNDFEKRKLAEQRATKRLKGDNAQKGKIGSKRTITFNNLDLNSRRWFEIESLVIIRLFVFFKLFHF